MNGDIPSIIFNSISDGVFTVDRNCVITSFNKSAERITGFQTGEAVGKPCFEIFRTELCNKRCALRDTLARHLPIENSRVTIITHDGREVPISVSTTVLRDPEGEIVGAVEFFSDVSEVEHLRQRLEHERVLDTVASASLSMRRILQMLPNIAESECNVLILGPSGVGKELLAQAIHNLSPRRYGPYIRLNCAALPATLLESELFGYSKGAFTDAKRDKPGMFAAADGGTLLLDEISDMDVSLQVKLLRVLNNGEYQPLGSTRMRHTDARIIASTNGDLKERIERGTFREDLYFRINVVSVDIPPLKERPEDLPVLVEHFIGNLNRRRGRAVRSASPEALVALRRYSFPGNVRELENAIEHAFVMCKGEVLDREHLPPHIVAEGEVVHGLVRHAASERDVIEEALQRHHGNRAEVAEELGMHRSTLWRKIKSYGIGS